ncbi:glutaredoxin [Anopheles sinensis]|uniref:Glutaredoxin n=1 Tax=Anopheles sinensis TaxID=74873 RepID=A0A084VD42_ANOSI|nr:glutaredoxin [Anopheles sinensis]
MPQKEDFKCIAKDDGNGARKDHSFAFGCLSFPSASGRTDHAGGCDYLFALCITTGGIFPILPVKD